MSPSVSTCRSALYWRDRGDPPRGNTMNRAPRILRLDCVTRRKIFCSHVMEGIGTALALDRVERKQSVSLPRVSQSYIGNPTEFMPENAVRICRHPNDRSI